MSSPKSSASIGEGTPLLRNVEASHNLFCEKELELHAFNMAAAPRLEGSGNKVVLVTLHMYLASNNSNLLP